MSCHHIRTYLFFTFISLFSEKKIQNYKSVSELQILVPIYMYLISQLQRSFFYNKLIISEQYVTKDSPFWPEGKHFSHTVCHFSSDDKSNPE